MWFGYLSMSIRRFRLFPFELSSVFFFTAYISARVMRFNDFLFHLNLLNIVHTLHIPEGCVGIWIIISGECAGILVSSVYFGVTAATFVS